MAVHYGAVVIPARVRKARDKAKVAVQNAERRILASSEPDLLWAGELRRLSGGTQGPNRPFQKMDGCAVPLQNPRQTGSWPLPSTLRIRTLEEGPGKRRLPIGWTATATATLPTGKAGTGHKAHCIHRRVLFKGRVASHGRVHGKASTLPERAHVGTHRRYASGRPRDRQVG